MVRRGEEIGEDIRRSGSVVAIDGNDWEIGQRRSQFSRASSGSFQRTIQQIVSATASRRYGPNREHGREVVTQRDAASVVGNWMTAPRRSARSAVLARSPGVGAKWESLRGELLVPPPLPIDW